MAARTSFLTRLQAKPVTPERMGQVHARAGASQHIRCPVPGPVHGVGVRLVLQSDIGSSQGGPRTPAGTTLPATEGADDGYRWWDDMHRLKGFWLGVVTFWLGFGVIYVIFRGVVDSKIVNVTIGDIIKLVVLVALWPLEVLGLTHFRS